MTLTALTRSVNSMSNGGSMNGTYSEHSYAEAGTTHSTAPLYVNDTTWYKTGKPASDVGGPHHTAMPP